MIVISIYSNQITSYNRVTQNQNINIKWKNIAFCPNLNIIVAVAKLGGVFSPLNHMWKAMLYLLWRVAFGIDVLIFTRVTKDVAGYLILKKNSQIVIGVNIHMFNSATTMNKRGMQSMEYESWKES